MRIKEEWQKKIQNDKTDEKKMPEKKERQRKW